MTSELAVKVDRVREVLTGRGAALTLTSRETLAWLLGGARVTVPTNGDPVLSARITADELTLFVYANEVDRLRSEELVQLSEIDIVSVPWHEPLPGTAGAAAAGASTDAVAEASVAPALRAARAQLLPVEVDRYRALGADIAAAVTSVARELRPEDSERHAAAALAHAAIEIGAEPFVLLVSGDARAGLRHPLPTALPLGRRAMLVLGARRHGLIANLTRFVGDTNDGDSDERLRAVEADAFAATRPGRSLADVLADIEAAYPAHGFAADEWLQHHQGGPTGYAGRDPRASPTAADRVVDGQAFAWNPSVPGGKAEDTVIITSADGTGRADGADSTDRANPSARPRVEVLTADPAWPAIAVEGVARPLPLPFG